jgi:uncharacterized protein (DUF433 family)
MGKTVDEMVAMYPNLTHSQVYDAFSYYYDHREELELLIREKSEAAVRKRYQGEPWML